MAKIPDDLIRLAAGWIADQQRDPFEDRCVAPYSRRRPYYFERARKELARMGQECENKGHSQIGLLVFRGRNEENKPSYAKINVTETDVIGYFDFDVIPAFSWPPEIREKIIARAAARSGTV